MATPVLAPNPSLLGIVLVIKTRSGVSDIFHYPPSPGSSSPLHASSRRNSSLSDTDSTISSSSGSDGLTVGSDTAAADKNGGARSKVNKDEGLMRDPDADEGTTPSPEKGGWVGPRDNSSAMGGGSGGSWFGSHGLTQLLAPDRGFHKKRFEMSLDGVVYLGWPVFVREDGRWQKRRGKRWKREEEEGVSLGLRVEEESVGEKDGEEKEVGKEGDAEEGDGKKVPQEGMTMFNVVFLMNPPPLEHHLRVTEMYDNVVKKFSRALKWEQAKADYVWQESQLILSLKHEAQRNGIISQTPHSIKNVH